MDIKLGTAVAINGKLVLGGLPYKDQAIQFNIYFATDVERTKVIESVSHLTDVDGDSVVVFDTTTWAPTKYVAEVTYKSGLKVDIPFTLAESGLLVTLNTDKKSYFSGESILYKAQVTTLEGVIKPDATVVFVREDNKVQSTAVTDKDGVASILVKTDPEFEGDIVMDATCGGAKSRIVVKVQQKVSLMLQGDKERYAVGETATFTATLTKGGKPYPNQPVDFELQ